MSTFSLVSASNSTTEAPTPAYITSPVYTDDEDEEDNLPYPKELPRSDFLNTHFDPQDYLSSLRNRHQTLEDLRSDLRARSQQLNQELLDLVNGNYEEFLSLGSDLSGGEDKVEGVRVGMLGFSRDIEALQSIVTSREEEFKKLFAEKKDIRQTVVLGRKLLDIESQLSSLEAILGVTTNDIADDEDDDLDADEDDEGSNANVRALGRKCEHLLLLEKRIKGVGATHPFIVELQPRLQELRRALLLDLSVAIRQAKTQRNGVDLLQLGKLFVLLDAGREAVQTLKTG